MTMRIWGTSDNVRQPKVPYPWHMQGPNSEEGFYHWALAHRDEIKTELIYLPVFWWNNSYWQTGRGERERDYHAVPESQHVLYGLDANERYFTVSNCDDGIYETLPGIGNVIVFNAGGRGDIPIPLLCDPVPPGAGQRDILASFVGNRNCGGPANRFIRRHSSWDSDGDGALLRREMFLRAEPSWHVKQGRAGSTPSYEHYCDVLQRSRFALCPRGYGLTSYRLYEAMDAGCAPVYLYTEPWLPYWDQLDWREFCVLCHQSEMEDLPQRLAYTDWSPLAKRAAALRGEFFTRDGCYRQIARYVERMN